MKLLRYNCRQYLRGVALVAAIAMPGSLLVLLVLAWWSVRRAKCRRQRPVNTGLRFSMNAVRPSV